MDNTNLTNMYVSTHTPIEINPMKGMTTCEKCNKEVSFCGNDKNTILCWNCGISIKLPKGSI